MPLPELTQVLDPIEQAFMDALQRLVDGKPTQKTLKALLKKKGKLPVNAVNVAQEAGHSRTLIAMDKCRYPKVREAIRLAKGGKTEQPTTYTQLIQNLRADLAQEKAQKKLLQLQIAEHFTARMTAEDNAKRIEKVVAQLRKEIAGMHKVIHLTAREKPRHARLVLIRGLPGTGKTTLAKGYKEQGYEHFEADMFFEKDGQYVLDEEKLPEAHVWCLQQSSAALDAGSHVVVANVFARLEDIKPYADMGFDFELVEATGRGESIHDIPVGVLRGMKASWVHTDALIQQLKKKASTKSDVTPIAGKKERN